MGFYGGRGGTVDKGLNAFFATAVSVVLCAHCLYLSVFVYFYMNRLREV